jgi:hypothetical protein
VGEKACEAAAAAVRAALKTGVPPSPSPSAAGEAAAWARAAAAGAPYALRHGALDEPATANSLARSAWVPLEIPSAVLAFEEGGGGRGGAGAPATEASGRAGAARAAALAAWAAPRCRAVPSAYACEELAPFVFAALRELAGVPPAAYAAALARAAPLSADGGSRAARAALLAAGMPLGAKGGDPQRLLAASPDGRIIIASLFDGEARALARLAPRAVAHFRSHPRSRLPRCLAA